MSVTERRNKAASSGASGLLDYDSRRAGDGPSAGGSGDNASHLAGAAVAASDNDFFIGVNLGVRRSQVGLTTLGGEILAEEDFDTPAEQGEALALIRASLGGALEVAVDGFLTSGLSV